MKKSILTVVVCAALGVQAFAQEAAKTSNVAARRSETIKWKFNGNDAGTNTYQSYPDGKFESVTDLNIMGTTLKSRLTGKLVDGAIAEFEMTNQQGATEAKVSAKDGKARITVGEKTREVEYKASKVLFGNIHPVLLETLAGALDPAKEGVQSIDVLVLDAAVTVKVDVTKKKIRAIEAGGGKQVADVYFVRFPSVEFDIYITEGFQLAAWDIPAQKLQAVRSGYEAFLVDTTTLHPELSQPAMKTKTEKGVRIKMRDGVELVADIVRPADNGMIGGSYGGWVQWAAAVEAHPALKCIAPQVAPPDLFFNFPVDHGVPMLWGAIWWSNFVKDKKVPLIPEISGNLEKLKTLPLSKVDGEVLGRNIPFYDEWLGKETPAASAGQGV